VEGPTGNTKKAFIQGYPKRGRQVLLSERTMVNYIYIDTQKLNSSLGGLV